MRRYRSILQTFRHKEPTEPVFVQDERRIARLTIEIARVVLRLVIGALVFFEIGNVNASPFFRIPPDEFFMFAPWFYIPVAILAVVALFLTVFISSVVFDLKAQANTFDLNKLDQMESASVILDRNGKIFGQIYVENRETVPYEKLAPDLINAVIAVEDAKFYEHHGYDLLGIIRAALKNLVAGHATRAKRLTKSLH